MKSAMVANCWSPELSTDTRNLLDLHHPILILRDELQES